jgi:hypothetical protein
MTNSHGLVSESCHESTFKLIRHHNFNDVLFSVGATWTFNKYNNIEKHVIIQNVKKRGIFSIETNYGAFNRGTLIVRFLRNILHLKKKKH